jgi:WD40 repeat protein
MLTAFKHRAGWARALTACVAVIGLRAYNPPASFAADAGPATKPASAAIEVAEVKRAEPVDFAKDVLPILRANCTACHNLKDAEADLNLETTEAILKGGENGPAVVPGKGDESLLLKVTAKREKPFMPPKNNKAGAVALTPQELGLIKLWIDQGAKGGASNAPATAAASAPTTSPTTAPFQWHPLPAGLNPIYSVSISADGQLVACNRANQIFVYSLPRRQLVTRLTDPSLVGSVGHGQHGVAHRDLVQSLAFSPDGKTLASGSYREVKLWQRPDPAVRFTASGIGAQRVGAVATSPDGKTLAAGGDDGVIRLINLLDGKPRAELTGHTDDVNALRFSDDGAQLFSGSSDRTIRIWNVADGAALGRVDTPQRVVAVLGVRAGKDGPQLLAAAGGDAVVRVHNMPTAAREISGGVAGPITAMAMAPDRKRLAVAGADRAVRLVDAEGAAAGAAFPAMSATVRAISFDAIGKQVLAASDDGSVTLSNADDGKPLAAFTDTSAGPLTAATIRPDGKQAVTATGDGRVSIWRLDAPAPRDIGPADEAVPSTCVVSPNNQLLATATTVGGKPAVVVRNIATGAVTQKLLGAEGAISVLAFSPDNARLAAACADKTARVWTLADGKEMAKFAGHGAVVTCVAFHPDNARVVTADVGGVVKVWTAADAKETRSIAAHKAAVTGLAILPKDQVVATSADECVNVFDVGTGAPVRVSMLGSPVTALAVTRDGARLAVATGDRKLRLLNAADGVEQRLVTTAVTASAVSFSADGKRLSVVGEGRAIVYDADSATPLEGVGGGVAVAAFAEKSDELVVVASDKTPRLTPTRLVSSIPGIPKSVARLSYSKDGSLLLVAGAEGTVRAFGTADLAPKYAAYHNAPVRDLALSPDGAWLATGGEDGLVKLWSTATGVPAPKPQVGPFGGPVTSVSFSADGRRVIACGGKSGETLVFNREQGTRVDAYAGGTQPLVALAAVGAPTDGGDVILAAGEDKSLRLVRTSLRAQLLGHTGTVTSLAALPGDPTRLFSGGADGTVRQWNVNSANSERQFAHDAPVASIAVRPDGKMLASAGGAFAKLFDLSTAQPVATLKGDRAALAAAQLAERRLGLAQTEVAIAKQQADATTQRQATETQALTAATAAKTAADKAVADKQAAATPKLAAKSDAERALANVLAEITAATDAPAKAEKQIASTKQAADAAGAKVTTLAVDLQKRTADAQAAAQAVQQAKGASDGLLADAAARNKAAADAKAAAEKDPGNQALKEAATAAAKAAEDAAAAVKRNADALAAAQQSVEAAAGTIKLATMVHAAAQKVSSDAADVAKKATEVKTATDAALAAAKARQAPAEAAAKAAQAAAAQAELELVTARSAAASADKAVVSVNADVQRTAGELAQRKSTIAVAESAAARAQVDVDLARKSATASEKAINAVAFAPQAAAVVTGGEDGLVRTYSVDTGAPCDEFRGHNGAVTSLTVAPDGTILSGAADRSVKFWDANPQWTLKATLGTGDDRSVFADRVLALAFSPDGSLLATGGGVASRSGELKVFSVATGQLFRDFADAHSDTVFAVGFSGDGMLLATGGADKFARVWDVASGSLKRSLEGHTHHVLDVSFRYDGRVLATAGAEGALKLWDVQTGEQRATTAGFSKFEATSVSHVGFTDRFLVTAGDGFARVVNETFAAEGTYDVGGANNFLYSGGVTPDGQTILTGGYDSVLHMRAKDGKVIADFGPPDAPPPTTQPK